jgi:hypothetical protein
VGLMDPSQALRSPPMTTSAPIARIAQACRISYLRHDHGWMRKL